MTSEYYTIDLSFDKKVTGVLAGGPQAVISEELFQNKKLYKEYYRYAHDSRDRRTHWLELNKFPKEDIELQGLKLEKGAKKTDFLKYADPISIVGDLILSEKAIHIITQFNLPPYRLYSVKIFSKGQLIDDRSKLFHCPAIDYSSIDFEESTFYKGLPSPFGKRTQLEIHSFDDWLDQKDQAPLFYCENLVLNSSFDRSLDLFYSGTNPRGFISSSLKEAILSAKLTGIVISKPRPGEGNILFS